MSMIEDVEERLKKCSMLLQCNEWGQVFDKNRYGNSNYMCTLSEDNMLFLVNVQDDVAFLLAELKKRDRAIELALEQFKELGEPYTVIKIEELLK